VSEDVMSADSLLRENAELRADRALLRAYLSEARSELNDARAQSAALVEACEALAQFIESYTPDSLLARAQPTFYGIFRVYGKNARAAVAAVRPQADALLAKMADLSRQIGEQNTTIGYQDAKLRRAEADAGWLRGLVLAAIAHLDSFGEISTPIAAMAEDLEVKLGKTGDAGAALLAELEAARAVAAAARHYITRETTCLPIEKADTDAIGALIEATRAYDAATKVSDA